MSEGSSTCTVSPYLTQRLYGGPDEGGWYYDAGELCTNPALTALGVTFPDGQEGRGARMSVEVQAHLDRDWNTGDHARPISSVLSAVRFEDRVHDGWPPLAFPAERPRCE